MNRYRARPAVAPPLVTTRAIITVIIFHAAPPSAASIGILACLDQNQDQDQKKGSQITCPVCQFGKVPKILIPLAGHQHLERDYFSAGRECPGTPRPPATPSLARCNRNRRNKTKKREPTHSPPRVEIIGAVYTCVRSPCCVRTAPSSPQGKEEDVKEKFLPPPPPIASAAIRFLR